jgi:hypothetical protein
MDCARQAKACRLTSLSKPRPFHGGGGVRSEIAIDFPATVSSN